MTIDEIFKKLPTRDEMARLVGVQPAARRQDDILAVVGLFGTGVLVGAGLALLFAPKPGSKLRQEITKKLHAGAEKTHTQTPSELSAAA